MEFDFLRQHEEKVQQASAVSVMDGGESNASSGHLTWVLNWSTSPGVCSHVGKAARVLWSELMWAGRQSQVKAAAEASPLLLCGALAASFSSSLREPADTEPDGRSPVCPPICLSVWRFHPAGLHSCLSPPRPLPLRRRARRITERGWVTAQKTEALLVLSLVLCLLFRFLFTYQWNRS